VLLLLLLPLLLFEMWGRGREHCTGPAADDTAGVPLLLWVFLLLLQQLWVLLLLCLLCYGL
jgi:hypothetical protein